MSRAAVVAVVVLAAAACGDSARRQAIVAALQSVLSGEPPTGVAAAVWKDAAAFYQGRAHAPAWVDDDGPSRRALAALDVLRRARDHGLAPERYDERGLTTAIEALRKQDDRAGDDAQARALATLDLRVTTALLSAGRDVALGTTLNDKRQATTRRAAPDFATQLAERADGDLQAWFDTLRPRHAAYAALQKALVDLHAENEKGGWSVVPGGTWKAGTSHPSVAALRRRLIASGDLAGPRSAEADVPVIYDDTVVAAVRSFQERNGLNPTGLVDQATLVELNTPIDTRIRQVERNLDRWRRLPDDLGSPHLLVNIPQYHVFAREGDRVLWSMKVIVGTPENPTPIFSDEMETVVFSPYWNIPDTIVAGETAPAVARDSGYLAKNQIEILRRGKGGAQKVDPSDVDWDDPAALKELAFRQKPGAHNALGHVKFLFPNDYDVYLHDTPADNLFSRTGRAFSHGCVRVENPEALAKYVLRDDPKWDEATIRQAMYSGEEEHVKLSRPLPVHLTYFTASVDQHGRLAFFKDIYGLDGKRP